MYATVPVVEFARDLMNHCLADLPSRRAHSEGVAKAMRTLNGDMPPHVQDQAEAIGLLHDIGYGRPVTGHHAIDGALVLAATDYRELAPHVAWHSTAKWEAAERGIDLGFPAPPDRLRSALWVADFTTTPDGAPCAPERRIADIRSRYGPDTAVIRALDASLPSFKAALAWHGLSLASTCRTA